MDFETNNTNIWNEDKLLDFIKANGHLSPDHLNDSLLEHLNHVVKSKSIDDITLLTLRIF